MPDARLSELTALAGASVADTDLLYIDDVSAGTSGSKSITVAEFAIKLGSTFAALSHNHDTRYFTEAESDARFLAIGGTAVLATALATPRNINGVAFDGTANITVAAAAGSLTGTTLAANVVTSSLTAVGTLVNLTVTNPITGSVTGSSGSTTGNAATATALQTARNINGVAFDGTANITVPAAAGTLTGATLAANVLASSLTSVGTLLDLTVTNTITGSVSGNAATATALQNARTINGTSFDGTANITVTAAAGTLTGTVLNATVVTSSLTAVGTIATGVWNGTTIAIANGGTGQTTANAAFNALAPSQATHSGKYLTTDGTNTSWAAVAGGGSPGGADTQVQFNDGGAFGGDAGLTYNKTTDTLSGVALNLTGTITSTFGAITTSKPALTHTATWDANVTFETIFVNITEGSNWATTSNLAHLKFRNTTVFRVGGDGSSSNLHVYAVRLYHTGDEWSLTNFGLALGKTVPVVWSSTDFQGGSKDTGLYRNAAGVVEVNNGTAGTFRDIKLRDLIATAALNVQGAAASVASGISIGGATRATVGAAGGASALPATPTGYLDWYVGATAVGVPYYARGA